MSEMRWVTVDKAAEETGLPASFFHERTGLSGEWPEGKVWKWFEGRKLVDLAAAVYYLPDRSPMPATFEVRPQSQQLYRHYDAKGVLLYVGISLSAVERLGGHKAKSPWIWSIASVTIENFATRAEAEKAERYAIHSEHPIFNGTHGIRLRRAKGLALLEAAR